jgi:hypothetical protein
MISLTPEEEQGLKIIALLREGKMTGFNCSECKLQEQRNCTGAEEHSAPVFVSPELGDLYVCPILLIPRTIIQWVDEYDFYEKYPSAVPSYKDINPRFWIAVKFYESFKGKLSQPEDKQPVDSQSNMDKMRQLTSRKKRQLNG